jgi:hypothetical protein
MVIIRSFICLMETAVLPSMKLQLQLHVFPSMRQCTSIVLARGREHVRAKIMELQNGKTGVPNKQKS